MTAKTMTADFLAQAEALEAAAAPSIGHAMISAENFVVMGSFGALTFKTERLADGRIKATSTGFTTPDRANRFTREDAQTLALACNGRAVFWRDACREVAADLRDAASILSRAA